MSQGVLFDPRVQPPLQPALHLGARVSLVSMPFLFWDAGVFPVMALPYLTAYLRRAGCVVTPHDFNVESWHWLCRLGVLADLQRRLEALATDTSWASCGRGRALVRAAAQTDGAYLWCPLMRDVLAANAEDFRNVEGEALHQLWGRLHESLMSELPYEKPCLEWSTDEMADAAERDCGTLLDGMLRGWLAPRLAADAPDMVAFSIIAEDQLFPTMVLAREIKRRHPSVVTVAGGPLISAIADKLHGGAFRYMDHYVRFDGEPALDGLLQVLEHRALPAAVPNLVWTDEHGDHVNPVREGPALDFLPPPDFEGLDMARYNRSERVEGPWLSVNTTKGCAYGRCTYCSDPSYSSPRFKSPDRVVAEMADLTRRYGIRKFLFADSYIPPAQMRRIATALSEARLGVRWVMQTRPETALTDEVIAHYAASGCNELWFGMESINEDVLSFIQKGIARQTMERIIAACVGNGIKVTLNVMVGVPGESEAEAAETLSFVDSLNDQYPELVFRCNTSFVNIPRLSAFGKDPARFGIEITEEFDWSPVREWVPPRWVFEGDALRGQRRIFSSAYLSGAEFRSGAVGRLERVDPGSVPLARSGVYTRDLPFDPTALLAAVGMAQQQIIRQVMSTKCRRADAWAQVDREIAARQPARRILREGTYTFHVSRTLNRKVVELKPAFLRLLAAVDDHTPASGIPAKLEARTPRDNEACSAGLAKLFNAGMIDLRRADTPHSQPLAS